MSKRTVVNGVNLHYVVAGEGPVVLGMRGWPQSQREFLPLIEKLAGQYLLVVCISPSIGTSQADPIRSAPGKLAKDRRCKSSTG
jgi:hypothetical protein